MGTRKTRQFAQDWFNTAFQAAKEGRRILDLNKLIGAFCLDTLSSLRTAKEFIKLFEMNGTIKVTENEVEVL